LEKIRKALSLPLCEGRVCSIWIRAKTGLHPSHLRPSRETALIWGVGALAFTPTFEAFSIGSISFSAGLSFFPLTLGKEDGSQD